jgi:hypothetical protein
MTDQAEPFHQDIKFLAERAGASGDDTPRGGDKGDALLVLLTALSSNARFNQHHDRERAELLASIRR